MFVLLAMCCTFVAANVLTGCVVWLACRRVLHHLQGDRDATKAVVENFLMPLLGRRKAEPDANDVRPDVPVSEAPSGAQGNDRNSTK